MSKMPHYDATAGFPPAHVEAFKRVACRKKVVISSRELNPLCTDLVLEGYAAKGFHIKAKTCDWGPMAGFVPEDYRFTKGSQNLDSQKKEIGTAFTEHHAKCVPLFISEERVESLVKHNLMTVTASRERVRDVTASPDGGAAYNFVLVKTQAPPPGCDEAMWAINYDLMQSEEASPARSIVDGIPRGMAGPKPVYGMANPHSAEDLGIRAAVAGDYDLWCVFPHSSDHMADISSRPMDLRATMLPGAGKLVRERAAQAGLIFKDKQALLDAAKKEDQHLGNISDGIRKIRVELNRECNSAGGDVVQHSDYGGNPFGTIDYPLIFFVPDPAQKFLQASVHVAHNMSDLKPILHDIQNKKYILKLNPAWSIPSF